MTLQTGSCGCGSGYLPGCLESLTNGLRPGAITDVKSEGPTKAWENGALRQMATETIPVAPPEAPGDAPNDELDLVARARGGDGRAFSTLVSRYEGKIFRLAMNITQNREDAE